MVELPLMVVAAYGPGNPGSNPVEDQYIIEFKLNI